MLNDDVASTMNPIASDQTLLQRRKILQLAGASTLLCCGASSGLSAADELPKAGINAGDLLVAAKGDTSTPLKASDIKAGGKPLLVYPFDIDTKKPRSESRLNKLLLVRVDPKDLSEEARARSVDGVLAFSAVCTHQGCDVTEWKASEKTLLCFCHSSQFNPFNNGAVAVGPAAKALPSCSLVEKDGVLVLASGLNAKPGV
jgi:rieske iron-sulfur protein